MYSQAWSPIIDVMIGEEKYMEWLVASSSRDRTVRLWSSREGKDSAELEAGFVDCLAINQINPSTIAIGARNGQIRVWRMGGREMFSMTCIHAKMNQSKVMSLA